MNPKVSGVLKGLGVLKLIQPEHSFAERLDALQHAGQVCGPSPQDPIPQENLP